MNWNSMKLFEEKPKNHQVDAIIETSRVYSWILGRKGVGGKRKTKGKGKVTGVKKAWGLLKSIRKRDSGGGRGGSWGREEKKRRD